MSELPDTPSSSPLQMHDLEKRLSLMEQKHAAQKEQMELQIKVLVKEMSDTISGTLGDQFKTLEGHLLKALSDQTKRWESEGLPKACDAFLEKKDAEKQARRNRFWGPVKKYAPWVITAIMALMSLFGEGGVMGALSHSLRFF